MKISYAIPVCNELVEIRRLIDYLIKNKREQDEIVVLFDSVNGSRSVEEYLRAQNVEKSIFRWHPYEFNRDFAEMKNYLTSMCDGDFIFQIDADEYPDDYLMDSIEWIVDNNPEVDVFWVPRINTVQGITPEHVTKWGWVKDSKGRINFPDYQCRIYRNSEKIKWVNKVHEKLTGFTAETHLPANEEFCLIHHKTIDRQERQNHFYETL